MASPKNTQNQMKKELGRHSDMDEWVKTIKEFFLSKFGIKLSNVFLFTIMKSENPILYPYDRNQLKAEDIEEIRRFFKNELKMHGGDRKLKAILNELKRRNISNDVLVFEFYYDISFKIDIFVTYVKINEKDLFILNFIEIERFGKRTDEIMREAAKDILNEVFNNEE